jgi:hypothetical protein
MFIRLAGADIGLDFVGHELTMIQASSTESICRYQPLTLSEQSMP